MHEKLTSLRARDIERYLLLDSDVHPKVRYLLKELAEQHYQSQKQIAECVSLMQGLFVIAESFDMVATGMKKQLEDLKKVNSQNET